VTDIPKDAREVYVNDDGEPVAYLPKDGFGITDIQRWEFFQANRARLVELEQRSAQKAQEEGGAFCVVCIDVDDPAWTTLVDLLIPGHDWDAIRAQGQKPVARGVVPRSLIVAIVEEVFPAAGAPPVGVFSAVFAAGGGLYVCAAESSARGA
jgi:hypothetical protein